MSHRVLAGWLVPAAVLASAMTGCTRYEYREPDCPPDDLGDTTLVVESGAPPGEGSLMAGRVVDSRSREPLGGSQVMLVTRGDTVGALADSTGRFEIDGTAEGPATLTVAMLGYRVRSDTLEMGRDHGLEVIVPLRMLVLDGCPGFSVVRVRKPWWKFW